MDNKRNNRNNRHADHQADRPPVPNAATDMTATTVEDWLRSATQRLQGTGRHAGQAAAGRNACQGAGQDAGMDMDSARLDARLLLQAACGMSAAELIAHPERHLTSQTLAQLELMLRRRLAHEPVSRILGWREFYGRRFKITPATLDPRPDSETLIDAALQIATREGWCDKPVSIIDVGTGSGCLLLTLLAELPKATGLGTDISGAAIEIARHNAQLLGVAQRAAFLQTESLDGVNKVFDLLVSNPPYIASGDIAQLAAEVRRYDPLGALDGGADGLDVYRTIGCRLSRVITKGWALFEVAAGQAASVTAQLAAANPSWKSENSLNLWDLAGHRRVVALRPSIGGK